MQRHCVGDQTATGFELFPAGFEHPYTGDAAADEDGVRAFQPRECLRCLATNQLQTGHAQCIAVVLDQLLATIIGFDGQGAAARMRTHPLDTDRTAAGADIPKQFAGGRGEAGEGDGAHVAFGQLAVMLEGRIRQSGETRKAQGLCVGQTFDGDDIEVGHGRGIPGIGGAVDAPFGVTAKMLKHAHATRTEAALAEQLRHRCRALAIVAQQQQAHAAEQLRIERRQRSGHQRQRHHLLQWPAETGGGQRAGRRGGQDQHLFAWHLAGEAGTDAVEHRVTAGQYANCFATLFQHRCEGERAGPQLAFAANTHRQQIQLTLATDDPRGAQQGTPGVFAQALEAVFTDSHYRQPG
ncbi:hypothetical protein D3C72_373680 [compost metagenome]